MKLEKDKDGIKNTFYWCHLRYMMQIAILRLKHSYLHHNLGYTDYLIPTYNIKVRYYNQIWWKM